jgi:hypothetical protein
MVLTSVKSVALCKSVVSSRLRDHENVQFLFCSNKAVGSYFAQVIFAFATLYKGDNSANNLGPLYKIYIFFSWAGGVRSKQATYVTPFRVRQYISAQSRLHLRRLFALACR